MTETLLAIPFLPLLAFLLNLAWGRRLGKAAGWLSVFFIAVSFVLSLSLLPNVSPRTHLTVVWPWLGSVRSGLTLGYVFDPLAEMMLIVVSFVSTMVQLYSIGYMADDERFHSFFAEISLFTFSMLGLVLAPNLLEMFMFWELVGLSSYLLIGFWFRKPEAASAAKKAFIVTRVGDFGFLIGILVFFATAHTLDIARLGLLASQGRIAASILTLGAILVFAGAVGKSAQFPLHVWLPDAMEGPTPVSALIHAATMVAAGVYLVARAYPVFAHSTEALHTVAWIGGFTAVFAASIGLLQYDIKRVIAYSTISQLGYMMLGLGVGAYSAGVFHLMNHAFFKALLFLTAGSIIHATGTQDLREMGGLGRSMKITMLTFLAGALALAGIFPFSGFWSKDFIIEATQRSGETVLWVFALLGAFFTAFYIFRVFFLAFTGPSRLPSGQHPHGHGHTHGVHESPPVMTIPLILLGLLATFSAFVGLPFTGNVFQRFIFYQTVVPNRLDLGGAALSLSIAVLAILLSYLFYGARVLSPGRIARAFPGLYNLVYHKYYFDELYAVLFVRPSLALARGFLAFDRLVIDGVVNAVAFLTKEIGHGLKYLESGRVQSYAVMTFLGLLVIILTALGGRI